MHKKRKYFIFVTKKLAKLAQITLKNKENVGILKKKEEDKQIVKIAESCAKIVHREFWRNIQKMLKFNDTKILINQQKKHQQKRLETLVTKQLQLSSKMADYLNKKFEENKENLNEKIPENNDDIQCIF